MTIIYRETDPVSGRWTGNSGGIDLSAFQIDQNFYEAISRIATLEANESFTVSIGFITQDSPATFTFHMTNHTLQGPFTIPASVFVDRGAWAPFTAYFVNDTFTENGTLYLVIFAHTSAATFSAGANDGLGHNYYSAMLSLPGNSLPTGGAAKMMLTKSDGHDFDVTWSYPVPVGGTVGKYLKKNSNSDFDMTWSYPIPPGGVTGQFLTKINATDFNVQWTANPLPAGGTTGQVLSKISGTDFSVQWTDVAAGISMEVLSDFAYTSPHSVNQVVQWNGANWQNAFVMMDQLSDVTLTSITAGQVLQWNGGAWVNVTVQPFDAQLFSNIPQNSQSAAYTTILTDGEKHIFHPSADTSARTWTIDSNANVAYPVGTVITFVNQNGAGVVTIAITADTMRLAGSGSTGSRSLAANGIATALKVTATEWIISGTGLT